MLFPSETRIGSYEILAPIGADGMGEVSCATDTHDGVIAEQSAFPQVLGSRLSGQWPEWPLGSEAERPDVSIELLRGGPQRSTGRRNVINH